MKQNRINHVIGCVIIMLGINVVQLLVYGVMLMCGIKPDNMGLALPAAILNGGLCLYIYRKLRAQEKPVEETLSWRVRAARFFFSVLGGSVFCLAVTFALTGIATLFPQWFVSYNAMMEKIDMQTSAITILYVMLVAPVSEECIFRGALLSVLSKEDSFLFANVLQALFFGIYHGNLIQGIYAFIMGMVLGFLYRRTKTLSAPILFHIAFNATTVLLDYYSRL